jgi:hypothetical protein
LFVNDTVNNADYKAINNDNGWKGYEKMLLWTNSRYYVGTEKIHEIPIRIARI